MNLFGTGGIDLVLSLQARSRSAGQGACIPVIGNGNSDRDQMLKLFRLKAPIMEMVESLVGLTEIILEYALLDKTK